MMGADIVHTAAARGGGLRQRRTQPNVPSICRPKRGGARHPNNKARDGKEVAGGRANKPGAIASDGTRWIASIMSVSGLAAVI